LLDERGAARLLNREGKAAAGDAFSLLADIGDAFPPGGIPIS